MRRPYQPNPTTYEIYYRNQLGHGLPVFRGGMRGRGLGSILSGLLRTAVPLLKQGGKALLKEGLRGGVSLAQDVLEGKSVKSAVKQRAKNAGKRLLNQAIGQFQAPAPPGEPARKRIKKPTPKRKNIRRKRKQKSDIFD